MEKKIEVIIYFVFIVFYFIFFYIDTMYNINVWIQQKRLYQPANNKKKQLFFAPYFWCGSIQKPEKEGKNFDTFNGKNNGKKMIVVHENQNMWCLFISISTIFFLGFCFFIELRISLGIFSFFFWFWFCFQCSTGNFSQ